MSKKPIALLTALFAGSLSLSAVAQTSVTPQNQPPQSQPGMQTGTQTPGVQSNQSIRVGHDVVEAVDDLRESVSDLVSAVRDAGEGIGLTDWAQQQSRLDQMQQQLDLMEQTLKQKADNTDEGWRTWLTGEDYKVTVTDQVNMLANHLNDLATLLGGTRGPSTLQTLNSHRLVGRVEDVREAVADLTDELSNAGPQFGWSEQDTRFTQIRQRLDQMEQELKQKGELDDEQWGTYQSSQEYGTFVHGNLYELAQIVQSLFQQGSGSLQPGVGGQSGQGMQPGMGGQSGQGVTPSVQ